MPKEYRIASCLGEDNVQRAIQEKSNETPPWEVHSITPAGLQSITHPLQVTKTVTLMAFLVLFERENFNA